MLRERTFIVKHLNNRLKICTEVSVNRLRLRFLNASVLCTACRCESATNKPEKV